MASLLIQLLIFIRLVTGYRLNLYFSDNSGIHNHVMYSKSAWCFLTWRTKNLFSHYNMLKFFIEYFSSYFVPLNFSHKKEHCFFLPLNCKRNFLVTRSMKCWFLSYTLILPSCFNDSVLTCRLLTMCTSMWQWPFTMPDRFAWE